MRQGFKKILIVLEIGGGFMGLAIILQAITNGSFSSISIGLLFSSAYIFGIYAGLVLIEDEHRGLKYALLFFITQIPVISSPMLVYSFSSGFMVQVFINTAGDMGGLFHLGSQLSFYLFNRAIFGIGVNLFAVVMVFYITKAIRAKKWLQTTGANEENPMPTEDPWMESWPPLQKETDPD